MPPCGTFSYSGVVPQDWSIRPCLELHDDSGAETVESGEPKFDNRLVGLRPVLEVLAGCFKLTAPDRRRSNLAAASFELASELSPVIRSGDVLHLRRTETADIGVSLLRRGHLVFAVGAVSVVPLGDTVVIRRETATNRPAPFSDDWLSPDAAVVISVLSNVVRLEKGTSAVAENLRISVLRCFEPGLPGLYECVAMSREQSCPHTPVVRSGELLLRPGRGLTMTRWS